MELLKNYDIEIKESVKYLDSEEAFKSIEANAYWPKWNSPWWHMTLLNEMGLAGKIPERIIQKMTSKLKASPLTVFPIRPGELPKEVDLSLDTHCHCALGNIYQALAAWGLDIDLELPWIRKWFLKYQLPDGGFNCDNNAYLKNPPPSSMVGTILPLEAILFFTPREFTKEEIRFLDLGAQCLIKRQLMYATSNPHNAEENEDEEDWLKLCFPRFYLYDVLRGLNFLLKWSDRRNQRLNYTAISKVVEYLERSFSDGLMRIGRHSFENVKSLIQSPSGEWIKRQPASHFPLLNKVSGIRDVSPFLSDQWREAKVLMRNLIQRGLLPSMTQRP